MKISLSVLIAVEFLSASFTVNAADAVNFGSSCCADLEERVAELEATTARKGASKLSLMISGWVGEQILWWDDGSESNTYVEGLGTAIASTVKLSGQATIAPRSSAGYVLQIEIDQANPGYNNQYNADNNGNGVNVYQSYWFVKNDQWGKLSVGLQEPGSDNAAIMVDGSGSIIPANWGMYDNASFFVKSHGVATGVAWGDFGHCNISGYNIGGDCIGVPGNYIVYNSPIAAGFSFEASWGEKELWDITGRYAGEHAGFRFSAVASYAQRNSLLDLDARGSVSYLQLGGYVEHDPSGLFMLAAYGQEYLDGLRGLSTDIDENPNHWHLKAGVRHQWMPIGHTVLYGQFVKRSGMDLDVFDGSDITTTVRNAEINQWGVGVVQEVDAAAVSFFLAYKHFSLSGDLTDIASGNTISNFDDFDVIKAGAWFSF